VKRIIALVMLAMLLLSACGNTILPQEVPELLVPVEARPEITPVLREDVVNLSIQNCTVVQHSEAVKFETDGVVSETYVFPGQTVQKGDLIAVLQVESMQEQLESLQTRLAYASSSASMTYRKLELAIKIQELQLEDILKTSVEELEESNKGIAALEAEQKLLDQQITVKRTELEMLQNPTPAEPDSDISDDSALTSDSLENDESEGDGADDSAEKIAVLEKEILALEESAKALRAEHEAAVQAQKELISANALEEKMARTYLTEAKYNLAHAQQDNSINMESLIIQINNLQDRIQKATLYAPASGVITWISAGMYAGGWFTSEDPVLYISDPDKVMVHTEWIEPSSLARCEKVYAWIGDQEYVLKPDEAALETDVSKLLSGETMSTVFRFEDLEAAPSQLSGVLFLQYGHRDNVISVPRNAVFRDQTEYYVYKMVDNRRERVEVEVGLVSAMRCEIISGLEEGDIIYVTE